MVQPVPGRVPADDPAREQAARRLDDARRRRGQALEVKAGEWVPPADLAPAFDPLPKELIVLGVRDPRPTLPENLASLPATIQRASTRLHRPGSPAGRRPRPRRHAPPRAVLVFNIPVERLPKPEDLRERLFPGSFAVSSDDQEIRYRHAGRLPRRHLAVERLGASPPRVAAIQAAAEAAAATAVAEADAKQGRDQDQAGTGRAAEGRPDDQGGPAVRRSPRIGSRP